MELDAAGFKFIEAWEGRARWDAARQLCFPYLDVVKVKTIGVGHVILAGESFDAGITDEHVTELLGHDTGKCLAALSALGIDFPQSVINGVTSALFNCGVGMLVGTIFGAKLRARDIDGAATALLAWCHAGGAVNAGLLNRRKAERLLMLTGVHPVDIIPHEPGLRPDIPTAEIEAQGAALWLSDREDFGARQIPETD